MDKFKTRSNIQVAILLELTETEARALEAIVGYGTESFLSCFYQHLGKHYLQPYEGGVHSLFEAVKRELPPHIARIDKARKAFEEK